jgi:hypothetical protein
LRKENHFPDRAGDGIELANGEIGDANHILSPVDTLFTRRRCVGTVSRKYRILQFENSGGMADPNKRFYQSFSWEKGGKIYQCLFRNRFWKRFIPDGSSFIGTLFRCKLCGGWSLSIWNAG